MKIIEKIKDLRDNFWPFVSEYVEINNRVKEMEDIIKEIDQKIIDLNYKIHNKQK